MLQGTDPRFRHIELQISVLHLSRSWTHTEIRGVGVEHRESDKLLCYLRPPCYYKPEQIPALEDGPAVGLLEAASYGLPIVASDIVTHRDFLADGTAVRTYPRGDVDALARALEQVSADPATAAALGAAARRTALEERSLAKMVDAYERILADVTAARSSARNGGRKGAG